MPSQVAKVVRQMKEACTLEDKVNEPHPLHQHDEARPNKVQLGLAG
jgi:hypothetical protein